MIWPFKTNGSRIRTLESNLVELKNKLESCEEFIRKIKNSESFLIPKMIREDESISLRSKKSIEEITRKIKDSISSVNNDSLATTKSNNELQYMIEDFDLEIKGGISVEEDELKFTQLHSTELDPLSVSTLKFKLRPIIKTRISE